MQSRAAGGGGGGGGGGGASSSKGQANKLGEIWDRFKGEWVLQSRRKAICQTERVAGRGGFDDTLNRAGLGAATKLTPDPSDPRLIKIEGTMEMCEELDIDPESVSRLIATVAPAGRCRVSR